MTSRTFSRRPKRKPSARPAQKPLVDEALEVLAEAEGSVTFGWLDRGVFYTRFVGALSTEIGIKFAARLQAALDLVPSLRYFSDASALKTYDLLARSAFIRVVLANRRKFTSLLMLTWSQGITKATSAFIVALGEPVEVLTDAATFEARLVQAAPLAKQKLDPKTWKRASRSAPPPR